MLAPTTCTSLGPNSPGNHWNHVHAALFDQGGRLPTGLTMVANATGSPELVLNGQQESAIEAVLRGRLTPADTAGTSYADGMPDPDQWGREAARAMARESRKLARTA